MTRRNKLLEKLPLRIELYKTPVYSIITLQLDPPTLKTLIPGAMALHQKQIHRCANPFSLDIDE
jgi:hypothetical protein